MPESGTFDFAVRQGNTWRAKMVFKLDTDTLLDLTGAEVVLRIVHADGVIRKTTADGGLTLDTVTSEVGVLLTPAETRSLTPASSPRYEMEVRSGSDEVTWLKGDITVLEGINDDA